MAAGLALHLGARRQPAVGRHLGRHVAGGVHADVDVLALARLLPCSSATSTDITAQWQAVCKAWLPPPRTGGSSWSS